MGHPGVVILEFWTWLGCAAFLVWSDARVLAAGLLLSALAISRRSSRGVLLTERLGRLAFPCDGVQTAGMRVAALLRGINVGPRKRIAMPALRAIVESEGHRDVETYLQSGNVVFTPAADAPGDLARSLEQAIAAETGLDVAVVLRTGLELARIVRANPYTVEDPTRLVVAFLADEIEPAQLGLHDLVDYLPDELTRVGRELYISVPYGQARSKLMEDLQKRRQPTTVTVRNWRKETDLAEMTAMLFD